MLSGVGVHPHPAGSADMQRPILGRTDTQSLAGLRGSVASKFTQGPWTPPSLPWFSALMLLSRS